MDKWFYTVFSSLTSEKERVNSLRPLYSYHWCMGTTLDTHSTPLELSHFCCASLVLFDLIFYVKI